ncbi:hypothetical protein [Rhodococcus koreensis]
MDHSRHIHHTGHSNPRANDTPATTKVTPIGHHHTHADATGIDESSLRWKLLDRARTRWPQLSTINTRFRSNFAERRHAYVDGVLTDGTVIPLMRLRYGGSANVWGFAIYLGSSGKYQDSVLPNGNFVGSVEDALDCACGLYLGDPTAWQHPPTNL